MGGNMSFKKNGLVPPMVDIGLASYGWHLMADIQCLTNNGYCRVGKKNG